MPNRRGYTLDVSLECHICTAICTCSVERNEIPQAGGKMEDTLRREGWSPVRFSNVVVGYVCPTCFGQYVETSEEGDEEPEPVREVSVE